MAKPNKVKRGPKAKSMRPRPAWRSVQDQTAELFRRLGCEVEVEADVVGARGKHEVDVWVRFTKFGLPVSWVIECKHWRTRVPKEKAITLKGIVDDVGADRGVLLSTAGFQAGAIRVCERTNITLADLDGLKKSAKEELIRSALGHIETRVVEVRSALHDLSTTESPEPNTIVSRSLPGVDGGAVIREVGRLSMLEFGFDRVRLKKPPYPVEADAADRLIHVATVEEFVEGASRVVASAESFLKEQQDRMVK